MFGRKSSAPTTGSIDRHRHSRSIVFALLTLAPPLQAAICFCCPLLPAAATANLMGELIARVSAGQASKQREQGSQTKVLQPAKRGKGREMKATNESNERVSEGRRLYERQTTVDGLQ